MTRFRSFIACELPVSAAVADVEGVHAWQRTHKTGMLQYTRLDHEAFGTLLRTLCGLQLRTIIQQTAQGALGPC